MKGRMIAATAAVTMLAGVSAACPFCKVRTKGVFIGETTIMGNGTVRSWVDIGEGGKPMGVGVTLSKLALEGLPTAVDKLGMGPEFISRLPEQAQATGLNHVGMNWMPNGHEPDGIYNKPHIDFHFYTIPTKVRSKITLQGENLKRTIRQPAKGYMPANYITAPGAQVPYMGLHWFNMAAPEFHGTPFTSTMIYGSFDGKTAFIEPMITAEFLRSKPNFTAPVPIPEKFEKAGFYPTEYTVSYDEVREETTVALRKFVWREASQDRIATKTSKIAARK